MTEPERTSNSDKHPLDGVPKYFFFDTNVYRSLSMGNIQILKQRGQELGIVALANRFVVQELLVHLADQTDRREWKVAHLALQKLVYHCAHDGKHFSGLGSTHEEFSLRLDGTTLRDSYTEGVFETAAACCEDPSQWNENVWLVLNEIKTKSDAADLQYSEHIERVRKYRKEHKHASALFDLDRSAEKRKAARIIDLQTFPNRATPEEAKKLAEMFEGLPGLKDEATAHRRRDIAEQWVASFLDRYPRPDLEHSARAIFLNGVLDRYRVPLELAAYRRFQPFVDGRSDPNDRWDMFILSSLYANLHRFPVLFYVTMERKFVNLVSEMGCEHIAEYDDFMRTMKLDELTKESLIAAGVARRAQAADDS